MPKYTIESLQEYSKKNNEAERIEQTGVDYINKMVKTIESRPAIV